MFTVLMKLIDDVVVSASSPRLLVHMCHEYLMTARLQIAAAIFLFFGLYKVIN